MEINRETFKQLKKDYATAKKNQLETFLFQGHQLDIGYAKYLIEYLEDRYKDESTVKVYDV